MIKIGLTGNIASGKSEVEKIIAKFGYKVVDLDIVSHKLIDTTCKEAILNVFNTTDRKKLAEIVFKDKDELKKLENIIHPELNKYILDCFEKNKDEKLIVISGALIFEAGFSGLFNKIIYIDADEDLRLKRLMKRNSFDKKTALERINAQNNKFKTLADYVIENNTSKEDLEKKVQETLGKING